METNIILDIWPPIPYPEKFSFSSYRPKYCQPIKLQDYLNAISQEVNDEVYFWHADKHRSFLQVDAIIWVCPTRHAQSNQIVTYLCNISKETWGVKLIFCLQINTKVFYKLIISLWVYVARHAQNVQNNKFTISL